MVVVDAQDAHQDAPGPADYHPPADYHNGTPRSFAHSHGIESRHGTSAFASTTPRVELPSDVAAQAAMARPGSPTPILIRTNPY